MAHDYDVVWALLLKYGGKYILVPILAVFYPAWRTWKNRRRHEAAQDWPSVTATVHSVQLQEIQDTGTWTAKVTYSYFVEEYRAGQYLRGFAREDAADLFKRIMRDRKIEARYHPRNADRSVLNEDEIQRLFEQASYELQLTSPA